jgi:hypothetical protein
MKLICKFKHLDETWINIHLCNDYFFCIISPEVKWNTKTELERLLLKVVLDEVHKCKTIDELKVFTKYYINDYHFVYEEGI